MNYLQELKQFTTKINGFDLLQSSVQIDLFAYFVTKVEKKDSFTAATINECFCLLNLPPHSNISTYLYRSSKRSIKKNTKYYKKGSGYSITPICVDNLQKQYLVVDKEILPTDDLFSQDLFNQSRSYVKIIAEEASISYDSKLFNGCSVLIRRILETLLIESFERKNLSLRIKNESGNYCFLSEIINTAIKDSDLNLSRNTKQCMMQLKNIGDLSAHNRRYLARKKDIDQNKDAIRIVFEELLHIIDYPSWK